MKRVIKCVSLLICSVCLLLCSVFPAACLDYSEDSPNYIDMGGNFYIEVNTSQLGKGTIILSNVYKFDYLSTFDNSQNLYNTSNTTLNGYIYLQNGNSYQIRFQGFNSCQYYYGSGVSYGWQDLTISQLITSNGSILGDNGLKVYNINDSNKIIISVLIVFVVLTLIFGFARLILTIRKGNAYD